MKNSGQALVIDEIHKDKRALRQRRTWGRQNSGGDCIEEVFLQQKVIHNDCWL